MPQRGRSMPTPRYAGRHHQSEHADIIKAVMDALLYPPLSFCLETNARLRAQQLRRLDGPYERESPNPSSSLGEAR